MVYIFKEQRDNHFSGTYLNNKKKILEYNKNETEVIIPNLYKG